MSNLDNKKNMEIGIFDGGHCFNGTLHTSLEVQSTRNSSNKQEESLCSKIASEQNAQPCFTTYHATPEGVKSLIERFAKAFEEEFGPVDNINIQKTEEPLYTITRNPLIKEDIAFMVEEENGAWQYYHNYYFVTKTGQIYKYKANRKVALSKMNKNEIDSIIKTLDVKFLGELKKEELSEMLLKSKNVRLDSETYYNGGGFDMGDICYYAFNTDIDQKPILVGQRGNLNVHSKNVDEEDIAKSLSKWCR